MLEDEFEVNEEEFSEDLGIDHPPEIESRAFLVGAYLSTQSKPAAIEHLEELKSLADTFGVTTVKIFPVAIRKIESATYLPKGKLEEIKDHIVKTNANLVIFDEEISPAQQRNLEKNLKMPVMDRTELILEIFAQRAQTKEARLQIELAKTKYQFPRLKRLWSHFSRQRARGGYLKGEGEKQLEIDRRLLKKKLEKLKSEIEEVKKNRAIQRIARKRSHIPTFAIVGYTNAGKSTLLNALTNASVLVEDKLFATLDPTTRKFTLPNNQEVLLTDTVGFIRKLPHTLIAAFRSTLEAALHDDVLLHLIDISHPMAEEHAAATSQLLENLGAQKESIITIFNKADRLYDPNVLYRLRLQFTKAVVISCTTQIGFDDLGNAMMKELAEKRKEVKLKIPQKEYALVATIKREGNVLYEEYEENDVIIRAEIPIAIVHRFDQYII